MDTRDKMWQMLEKCVDLFDPVKEEYFNLYKCPAPGIFWAKNKELKDAMEDILVFINKNFDVSNVNEADKLKFGEEVKNAIYKIKFETLDDYKNYDISYEVFPVLFVRVALYNYRLPMASMDGWKEFSRKYVEYIKDR